MTSQVLRVIKRRSLGKISRKYCHNNSKRPKCVSVLIKFYINSLYQKPIIFHTYIFYLLIFSFIYSQLHFREKYLIIYLYIFYYTFQCLIKKLRYINIISLIQKDNTTATSAQGDLALSDQRDCRSHYRKSVKLHDSVLYS